MPTVAIVFRYTPRQETNEILAKVRVMERKAVQWLITNKKTSLAAVHHALYFPLREQFPELHSKWVANALRTATGIVHTFNKRKRKGRATKPELKKTFISLDVTLTKVSWNGRYLKVEISKTPKDADPITFHFVPNGKYRRILNDWKEGKCKMGQITLTPNSISIPFKYPDPTPYTPTNIIAIDSNENSLDIYMTKDNSLTTVDVSEVARINREYARRVQKATKGKQNPKAKGKIQNKYGKIARGKTKHIWNVVAGWLAHLALNSQAAIVLENLKHLKFNISNKRTSKRMRQRLLNHWSIMTFHRILEDKCKWLGVPIVFVDPAGTSKSCPICGANLRGQDKECPTCGLSRHHAAAINIAHRGMEKFPEAKTSGQGSMGDPRRLPSALKVAWWQRESTAGNPSPTQGNPYKPQPTKFPHFPTYGILNECPTPTHPFLTQPCEPLRDPSASPSHSPSTPTHNPIRAVETPIRPSFTHSPDSHCDPPEIQLTLPFNSPADPLRDPPVLTPSIQTPTHFVNPIPDPTDHLPSIQAQTQLPPPSET